MAEFARSARALGVRYLGICCGAGPHHVRAMAEALGRTPPASRYAPCMEKHDFFGDGEAAKAPRLGGGAGADGGDSGPARAGP